MAHAGKRLDLWLILGVFAISLALRLAFVVSRHFDGLYGQDAYAYYGFAQELRHAFAAREALTPFFWPLGYPALLAVAFTVFGATPLVAQAMSLLLGALLAPLVYLLARQIGIGMWGALSAALLVALCGQAIQSSIVVMADIPALTWATFSAICFLRYLHTAQRRWLVVAACLLALACITRWLYLALMPVWGVALLLAWRRIRLRETLAACVAAALLLIPQALVSIHSPYPVLNHAWVEGWQPANIVTQTFDNADGHFEYAEINALFYAKPYYDPYFLAPIFAPLIPFGVWRLRHTPLHLLILLGWALVPYVFLVGIPYQNIRFPLIVVPAVAVLVGAALDALSHHRLVFAVLLVGGLAFMDSAAIPTVRTFVANQQDDKDAVQWAIEQVPPDDCLYSFGLTTALQSYAPFEVRELYAATPNTLTAAFANLKPCYLFVNIWVIENQWAGRELQTSYHWLRDTVGLQYLNRSGNYLLFKVSNEDWYPASRLQFPSG